MNIYCRIIKRYFDLSFAIFMLIILIPVILLIVVLLYILYEDSIFYKQLRLGSEGKTFTLYKFRTMKENANDTFKNYLEKNNEAKKEWENNQKLFYDPRITKLGWFLREYSLDELPQFINVIKGDMSIVGPRPIVENEKKKYNKSFDCYIKVKPGITGLWQVSGRNNTTYYDRINYDLYYIENISFILDMYIMLKTIPAILTKDGAY